MQTINEDIKSGQFKQIYCLYGEEDYLKTQYKQKLISHLVQPGDTMNFAAYREKEIVIPTIIDLAETMPFFADRRVILLENSGLFKSAAAQLSDYVADMPDTTTLIFIEKEVDKRGKLYKKAKEIGRVVEFSMPDERTLMKWALMTITRNGKKITQPTMELFLEMTGSSMGNMEKELEKLICYMGEKEIIEKSDVLAICTQQTENRIFEMIDLMAAKRGQEVMDRYHDLLTLKEPPMRILYLITRQFTILLQVKTMAARGMDNQQIADKAGLRPFTIKKYRSQAGHFTVDQLKEALQDIADAEESVKTGRMNDQLSVEMILIKYSK